MRRATSSGAGAKSRLVGSSRQTISLRARSLPPGMTISDLRVETMRSRGTPCGWNSARMRRRSPSSSRCRSARSATASAGSPLGEVRVHAGGGEDRWRSRRGFTLVEVLVALAIVSIALLAALRAAGQGTNAAGELRLRLLAGWVAENRLAEHRARGDWLPLGIQRGTGRARAASSSPGAKRSSPRPTRRFAASTCSYLPSGGGVARAGAPHGFRRAAAGFERAGTLMKPSSRRAGARPASR